MLQLFRVNSLEQKDLVPNSLPHCGTKDASKRTPIGPEAEFFSKVEWVL
jgi:hypothetical protein